MHRIGVGKGGSRPEGPKIEAYGRESGRGSWGSGSELLPTS